MGERTIKDDGGPIVNALRLLEVLFDNKWYPIGVLSRKTALNEATARRTLETLESQKWVEIYKDGNTYRYHIAPKAFSRTAQSAINYINEMLEEKSNGEK